MRMHRKTAGLNACRSWVCELCSFVDFPAYVHYVKLGFSKFMGYHMYVRKED